MKKLLTSVIALAIVLGGVWATKQVTAQSTQAAPQLQFLMVDEGSREPNLPGECNSAGQRFGWASMVRDTIDNDNSDCAKVRITNPAERFTSDFRYCFDIGERVSCTPWATQGGGTTGRLASTGDWAIGYMNVWTETRPLSGNGFLEDVRAGLQWFELSDNSSFCGASGGMQWANGTTGAESNWTYGGARDNDPGCAELALSATYVAPYGADYVGNNIGTAPLQPNTTYDASRNLRITMRNTGHAWLSGSLVRQNGDCDGYVPGPNTPPCSYTKVVTADNIKLERIDAEPFQMPGRMSYEQTVTVTHESVSYRGCLQSGALNTTEDSLVARMGAWLLPTAHAMRDPDEPTEFPDPPCTPVTRWYERITEVPAGGAVLSPASVNIPMTFTTPAPGSYTLQFRMVKTDGSSAGTDPDGRFGEVANIPVTVSGTSTTGIGMTCPVAQLNIRAGDTASYAVTVASQGGFSGTATIAASGLPAGATSPGASVTVPADGSASGIVPIMTSSSTPSGTSTITFTATASAVAPASCTSLLVIDGGPTNSGETLSVRPNSQAVSIGDQVAYSAYYDADGTGPQTEVNVTSLSTWGVIDPSIARNDGGGRYSGVDEGTTLVRATYTGGDAPLTGSADITVIDSGSGETFSIRPPTNSVQIGGIAGFDAFHDPDGSGPQPERDVTGIASWSSQNTSVATHINSGVFRGVATGTTPIRATYSGMSDTASLSVTGTPTTGGQCGFTASPASIFIPPLRATTLSWNCTQPTSCRVTVGDTPRAGTQVASGGQTGSGTDMPPYSTTYRLSCDDGSQEEVRVRVFDVTTRIEILPQ